MNPQDPQQNVPQEPQIQTSAVTSPSALPTEPPVAPAVILLDANAEPFTDPDGQPQPVEQPALAVPPLAAPQPVIEQPISPPTAPLAAVSEQSPIQASIVANGQSPVYGQPTYPLPGIAPVKNKAKKTILIVVLSVVGLFVVGIIILVVFLAIPALQQSSWKNKNGTAFQTGLNNVKSDANNIATSANSQNTTALAAACTKLGTDTNTLKALPAYPISTTQAKFTESYNSLLKASTDCTNGLSTQSVSLLNKAGSELNAAAVELQAAVKLLPKTS